MRSVLLFLCVFVAGTAAPAGAQTPPPPGDAVFVLPADSVLGRIGYVFRDGWRYAHGDDPRWADPAFDDRAWPVGSTHLVPDVGSTAGWSGVGWFRLRFRVDSALVGRPLGLHVVQAGASEAYLDGRPLYALGTVGAGAGDERPAWDQSFPRPLLFERAGEHVLAVRYANRTTAAFGRLGYGTGFYLVAGDLVAQVAERVGREREARMQQVLYSAVPLAFALLFLFLFLFDRRAREHLYFALLTAAIGASAFLDVETIFAEGPDERILLDRLFTAASILSITVGLRFIYSVSAGGSTRLYAAFAGVGAGLLVWRLAVPGLHTRLVLGLFTLAVLAEAFRVIVPRHRARGVVAWIVGVLLSLAIAFMMLQSLRDLGFGRDLPLPMRPFYIGVLLMLTSMALYLSDRFARTTRSLEAQLSHVHTLTEMALEQERRAHALELGRQTLEADNARKTRELEDARRLQLAMLPRHVPTPPHLDVAVHMRTATEVGGDYYDVHLDGRGRLTLAVGDATGHGTAAGTLVAAVKSVFLSMAETDDLRTILHEGTRIVRAMRLGRLYMALLLARFDGDRLTVTSAGMPFALLYRARTESVEEIVLKGAPLGFAPGFPYGLAERTLEPGDALLFMSDGLAELFNAQREALDYPRVRALFEEVAPAAPDAVVRHLTAAADGWRHGAPPDDDITLVVVRVRDGAIRPLDEVRTDARPAAHRRSAVRHVEV